MTRKILTSQVFRKELQDIICIRKDLNNGMSRSEVCCMISDFFVVPFKTAANHFDYLRSKNMLPALKGGGRTVCTQATTTNCTATTTEKLLCNHANFVSALNLIRNLNGNSPEYKEVEDYFTLNGDESNFMASEGTVRVIANKNKRKQEKNCNNSRDSITGFRVGSAAETEGPRIFLIAGKSLDNYPSIKELQGTSGESCCPHSLSVHDRQSVD